MISLKPGLKWEDWNLEVLRSLKPLWIRQEIMIAGISGRTEKNFEGHKTKVRDREQPSLQHFNLHQCQSGTKLISCKCIFTAMGLLQVPAQQNTFKL